MTDVYHEHEVTKGFSDLERDKLRRWLENASLRFTKLDLRSRLKRATPQATLLMTCIRDQVMATSAGLWLSYLKEKGASQQHSVIIPTHHLLVFLLENKMPSYSCMATSSTVENAENVRRFREVGKYGEYRLENWVWGARNLNTWQSNCWVTEVYQRHYHTPDRYIIVIQKYAAVCILTALVTPWTLTFTQDTRVYELLCPKLLKDWGRSSKKPINLQIHTWQHWKEP